MQGRKGKEKMEKFNLNEENAGFYGMVFECAIKKALGKNAVVSPCGRVDLQKGKKYEIKQNGGELFPVSRTEIRGVSMVIYAPFIDMAKRAREVVVPAQRRYLILWVFREIPTPFTIPRGVFPTIISLSTSWLKNITDSFLFYHKRF